MPRLSAFVIIVSYFFAATSFANAEVVSARHFVETLYQPFIEAPIIDPAMNKHFGYGDEDREMPNIDEQAIFSDELSLLWQRHQALAVQHRKKPSITLSSHILCNCWALNMAGLVISFEPIGHKPVASPPHGAIETVYVSVRFTNYGEQRHIILAMAEVGARWRVFDFVTAGLNGEYTSLFQFLEHANANYF